MNQKERRQHKQATRIALKRTCQKLNCDVAEVYRLAKACNYIEEHIYALNRLADNGIILDGVYDFCVVVLAGRLDIKTVNRRKAKKRD